MNWTQEDRKPLSTAPPTIRPAAQLAMRNERFAVATRRWLPPCEPNKGWLKWLWTKSNTAPWIE